MLDNPGSPGWAVAAVAFAALALVSLVGLIVFVALWRRARSQVIAATVIAPATLAPGAPTHRQSEGRPPGATALGHPRGGSTTAPEPRAHAIRSEILQVLGDRCPAGWGVLVLAPPAHPRRMIWHVHLRPALALDLSDGRTVPTAGPPPDHEWTTPSGRRVALAEGEVSPPPTGETVAVRADGHHLSIVHEMGEAGSFIVRVGGTSGREHEYRAPASSPEALGPPLTAALNAVVGSAASRGPTPMGYSPAGWWAHERLWLHVLGR